MITGVRARLRAGGDGDRGALLVLALVVITVFAVGIGALMSYSGTNEQVTVGLRQRVATTYDADGAAQAAIDALRHGSFNNNTSSATYPKCFGATATSDTLSLPNFYPGSTGSAAGSAAVSCTADPNTGASGGLVPISWANKPGNAILTLGQNSGEDGINVKALNNSVPFTVHGSVVSDSNINVTNGSLVTNAAVYAHSGCAGTISSVPAPACNSGTAADPAYPSDPAVDGTGVPAYRSAPTSCSQVVTFQPGYYDDAAALNTLTDGKGQSCKGSVFWFKPGTYYFDFHAGTFPVQGGTDLWTVGTGQLIAGTPVNSAGTVLASPPSTITVPGSCQSPISSTSAVGVQFIFGGDSQLAVSGSADAEICGSYHANRPPIAVYGLKTGSASPTSLTGLAGANVSSTGADAYTPSAGTLTSAIAAPSDARNATWTASAPNKTATLSLPALASPPSIPAGSIVTSAKLTITYGASTAVSGRTVTLTPSGGGPAITRTLSSAAQAAGTTQVVDLVDQTAGGLVATAHTYGLPNLAVAYSATSTAANNKDVVDSIQLAVTYTAPAFRAEGTTSVAGNCLAATYTGNGSGSCAVISTPTSYKGSFYIQGTTYTPAAPIDLTLSNITAQVLRFGVICRTLFVKETGSTSYIGPVIEVPDNSPGYGPGGTVVYLTVYVCDAASTCSTSTGTVRLRVRVLIVDPSGSPSPPGRQITVQSWAQRN